jgi:hypothetical protein
MLLPDGTYTGLAHERSNAGLPAPKTTGYYLQADTEKLTYKATRTSWAVTLGSGTPLSWPAGGSGTRPRFDLQSTTKVWTVTLNLTAAGNKI